MEDVKKITPKYYIYLIDKWFEESRKLPINQWSIFQRARRWMW